MSTALLVIDVQQSLVDEGIWEYERVIDRVNQLIATARSEHVPIVLVRDSRVEPNGAFHRSLRQAAALGYDVVLVADAHSTLDHEHLKAAQIVAHHNRILSDLDSAKGRVRVLGTDSVSFK